MLLESGYADAYGGASWGMGVTLGNRRGANGAGGSSLGEKDVQNTAETTQNRGKERPHSRILSVSAVFCLNSLIPCLLGVISPIM